MKIDIAGPEGNAFTIMGIVERVLKQTGREDEIPEVMERMKNGDYDNLCAVATEVSNDTITFYNSNEEEE